MLNNNVVGGWSVFLLFLSGKYLKKIREDFLICLVWYYKFFWFLCNLLSFFFIFLKWYLNRNRK